MKNKRWFLFLNFFVSNMKLAVVITSYSNSRFNQREVKRRNEGHVLFCRQFVELNHKHIIADRHSI